MSFDRYFIISMPTLNWIGKEAVVNHDKEVPFRLLRKVKSSSVGDNSQNLVIHGDNLEALKALMPYYIGKIKCIYIDPPYNTGNESWVYNDKVNSPKIKKWLGKVVGGQSEDLCRHDKWLCMMYPRLKLLKSLLKEDGVIFVSIDESEANSLRYLMDEIFGEDNFLSQITWRSKKEISSDNKGFSSKTEFVFCYRKSGLFSPNRVELKEEYVKSSFKNSNNDPKGLWRGVAITASKGHQGGGYEYEIITPSGKKINRTWLYPQESYKKLVAEKRVYFGKNGDSVPQRIMYLNESKGQIPDNLWLDDGTNKEGKNELTILFDKKIFDTPKPVSLLEKIINISCSENDIILDSFAGSATTGHAVLKLNKEDNGTRKFILVEMENEVAKEITAERLKLAIEKYDYNDGFEYCELDKPLFDEKGQIEETCEFNQFATYIYFTETQTNIDKNKIEKNFIGEHSDTEFYLIYKEKDKNILTKSFLSKIRKTENKKIVYADKNYLDEDVLLKYNIIFKQIPYEVKVY